jgi:hypothetical protein
MKRLISISLVCLICSGCTTVKNPLDWVFGRKAATVATQEKREAKTEDATVQAAQVEAIKTQEALASAADSPAVALARRTNGNVVSLLGQRQPLNILEVNAAKGIVAGILSQDKAKREAAEQAQLRAEGKLGELSVELGKIRTQLEQARDDAKREAANNLATANELRVQKLWTYGGYAVSFLASAAALYFQFGGAKAEKGLASLMAHVRTNYGDAAGEAASAAADWALLEGQQSKIFKMAAIFAAKTKSSQTTPTT